jgi:23S rRNA (guanosine2251-2'-O)-methyltransferase
VTNLVRALEELKRQNVWSVGLDERGSVNYDKFDYRCDFVLVLGREGSGLHELTRRTCDHLLRIPMAGKISSLNVSVAGAIVMYEAARQRRTAIASPGIEETGPVAIRAKRPLKGLGS